MLLYSNLHNILLVPVGKGLYIYIYTYIPKNVKVIRFTMYCMSIKQLTVMTYLLKPYMVN